MREDPRDPHDRLVERLLAELPPRRAPATLEARVAAELRRRAALPWWSRGFRHWPAGLRGAFLGVCGIVVVLTTLGRWPAAAPDPWAAAAAALSFAHAAVGLLASAGDWTVLLAHALPPAWRYGGLGVLALLYAALLGLGAAAYHWLYRFPIRSGRRP